MPLPRSEFCRSLRDASARVGGGPKDSGEATRRDVTVREFLAEKSTRDKLVIAREGNLFEDELKNGVIFVARFRLQT